MIVKRPEEGSLGSRLNSVQGREKGRRTQVIGSAAGLLGSLILFWSGDAAAVYALTTLGILGAVISFILLVTYGTRWYQDKQNADILRSGVDGEKHTLRILAVLPDTYTAVPNAHVRYRGKQSEMDLVVMGPNGIFIVETKNHRGRITGGEEDQKWIQVKTSRGGNTYQKEFYNPVKQVSTHVHNLAGFLREQENDIWVQGIVYFANPETHVNFVPEHGGVPVFVASEGGSEELARYIRGYADSTRRPLSMETIDRMTDRLVRESSRR